MPRHIILVGTAASRVGAIPLIEREPTAEVWGVSARGGFPKATRWFEIHRIDGTFEHEGEADRWRDELRKTMADVPELWMIYPEYDLHPSVRAGWHLDLVKRFDTYLMTSTFAWMMAQAIAEMAPIDPDGTRHFAEPGSRISIYGVDMEYGTEYRQQRQGFRSFIKIAEQLGIEVRRVVSGGLIYEPVPYPMWQDDPLLNKLARRNKEARTQLAQLDDSVRTTRTLIAQNKAILDHIAQTHLPGYDEAQRVRELERELDGLMKTSANISKDIVHWQGINEEQMWLSDFLQP